MGEGWDFLRGIIGLALVAAGSWLIYSCNAEANALGGIDNSTQYPYRSPGGNEQRFNEGDAARYVTAKRPDGTEVAYRFRKGNDHTVRLEEIIVKGKETADSNAGSKAPGIAAVVETPQYRGRQ